MEPGPTTLRGGGADSPSAGSYGRLKKSIRASNGIIQSIIVRSTGPDTYRCIEGNTRVAIYQELRRESKRKGEPTDKWDTIPAIVQDNMDESEAHKIRLQVHLVGNRQWNPYSKAKYLWELVAHHNMPKSKLVGLCGGDKVDIEQSIAAYQDMERHYRNQLQTDEEFDPHKYSAFRELQKPKIKESLYSHDYTEEDFAKWVIDGKIEPLNTVRLLPRILANHEARKTFLRANAREAKKKLDAPGIDDHLRTALITQLATAMVERLHKLDMDGQNEIRNLLDTDEFACLIHLRDELIELTSDLQTP